MNGWWEPVRSTAFGSFPTDPLWRDRQDLRGSVLDLMRAIRDGIVADEAMAAEIARIADDGSADGIDGAADGLRAIARNHRIRALEGRARLAGIAESYDHLIDPA